MQKNEKLSNFDSQNMFKSELENQQKNVFFFSFLGSVSNARQNQKYDHAKCQISKTLNTFGHF